jgi:hypothetical protein
LRIRGGDSTCLAAPIGYNALKEGCDPVLLPAPPVNGIGLLLTGGLFFEDGWQLPDFSVQLKILAKKFAGSVSEQLNLVQLL